MRVAIIGGGAREHALAWALVREGNEVVVAPGNAGTRTLGPLGRNVDVRVDDVAGIAELAAREKVDLVVVGPELPLTLGAVDALEARGVRAFGPSQAAARLEASKAFMKAFCARHVIPTASFAVFDDADAADAHVKAVGGPIVVKADGLAAGKGVVVAGTTAEALDAVDRLMRKREQGDAGKTLVIEALLPGEEASFHVVCDGERYVALAAAQDHKRVFDGDRGPNTGGMGAYAPAPIVTAQVREKVLRTIVEPTLAGMRAEGAPFRGVLFVGLMIETAGLAEPEPRVLEFNVRFGDPETSVLVPLLAGARWTDLLDGAARGDLRAVIAGIEAAEAERARSGAAHDHALSIVMAAEGYPARPRTGDVIAGLDAKLAEGAYVLHAGTSARADGAVVTAGGRVLAVGGRGATLAEAARIAYGAAAAITWPGEHHRADIGHRALAPVARAGVASESAGPSGNRRAPR